jgi:hypothetical protein
MGLEESKPKTNPTGNLSTAPIVNIDNKDNIDSKSIYSSDKSALIVGINYYGSDHELKDCINDAYAIKNMLINYYGYPESSILVITDDTKSQIQPTRQNIISGLAWLLSDSIDAKDYHPGGAYHPGTKSKKMFFHYSGHGINVNKFNSVSQNDKVFDRMDNEQEAIVPIDYNSTGLIYDFQLRNIINNVNRESSLSAIMDCCYSEDNLDLAYNVEGKDNLTVRAAINDVDINETQGDVMMISSCLDNQTDSDGRNGNGALTSAMINICTGNNYSIKTLLNNIQQNFNYNRLQQVASISFGKKHSLDDMFII